MKEPQKVISYRVREYTDSKYIVEEYSLCLQDELEYQQHVKKKLENASLEHRWGSKLGVSEDIRRRCSEVHLRENVWDKAGFEHYIYNQCTKHKYEHPDIHNIDRFNFFLATNYFCGRGTEQSDDLRTLNELTYQYMQRHNAVVYLWMIGAKIASSDYRDLDNWDQIQKMNGYLRHVGYIDDYEYEKYHSSSFWIVPFLRDIGYWDDLEKKSVDNISRSIRTFLSDAVTYYHQVQRSGDAAIDTQILKADEISHIECLNVGQANCSLGFGDADNQNPFAIFDLGEKLKNPDFVKKKLERANQKGIVVISHYDEDHINAVKHLNDAAADRVWILPQRRANPSASVAKLFDFIDPKKHIFLPDVDYSIEPFDSGKHILKIGNIQVYRGNCKKKDPNQSTSENARCLICVVKKDRAMLLPGDCLYQEFPPITFSVDYLAVPHHSCCYTTDIKNIDLLRLRELIVFAGPHGGYKHPDITHIRRLQSGHCPVIYLMKHRNYNFDNKVKIQHPQINITGQSHIVHL